MDTYKRSHYSPFDLMIVLSGIIFITVGLYFFFFNEFTSDEFRDTEVFGSIVEGTGSRKLGNSLQWFDVDKKTELYYGDMIFANNSKDIVVSLLGGGSVLTIPIESMIKISKSENSLNLDVSRGSVLIKSKKKRNIRLRDKRGRTRTLTVSKGSRIKITSKKSNVFVEAVQGSADLASIKGNKVIKVDKGKSLLVGPKTVKVLMRKDILSNKIADPLFETKIRIRKGFAANKVFEISSTASFNNVKNLDVNNAEIDIRKFAKGTYYLRVPKTLEYDSFELKEVKQFKISLKENDELYAGDKVSMSWNGRSELMYRVEVSSFVSSSSEDDSDSVKSRRVLVNKLVQGNGFRFPVKDNGDIDIKVTEQQFGREAFSSRGISLNKSIEDISIIKDPRSKGHNYIVKLKNARKVKYNIRITGTNDEKLLNRLSTREAYKLKLKKPGDYSVSLIDPITKATYFNGTIIIKGQIRNNRTPKRVVKLESDFSTKLRWKRSGKTKEEPTYHLRVFKLNSNNEEVYSLKTKEMEATFEAPRLGKYYWTVEADMPDYIEKSNTYLLNMTRPNVFADSNQKIILKYVMDKGCYQFKIKENQYAELYDVYIYSSKRKVKNKWKVLYHKKLATNSDCMFTRGEGKYYYNYRIKDKWNRLSNFSELGTIFFPISPLDDF